MKIQTNCRVSQVGKAFFMETFSNRRTGFASLVFIFNNFHLNGVFFSKQFEDFHRKY